ncbi:MAG: vanadium-dependent haloperoxidase [Mycobacteriales bacterium]
MSYSRMSRRRAMALAGRTVASAAALSLLPAAGRAAAAPAAGRHDDLVLFWYDRTVRAVGAAAFREPVTQSRAWAVSWLAAARAAREASSPVAAAAGLATALHDTLAAQVPAAQSGLDSALTATLAGLPQGLAVERGVAAGRRHAAAVLAERAGDGLDTASVDIDWTPPPAAPGVWQPTPPSFGPAVRAGQGRARPFLLPRGDRFRLGPPPSLTSSAYGSALAEVRAVGSGSSTVRTAAQTDVALFWEQNSIDAYVQVLRAVLAGDRQPPARRARLVAAFHALTIDAQIAVYDTKYAYVFWRPVTAIRTGEPPDPGWTPLLDTPRHPDYPSGHAGYAGAAQQALEALAGPAPRIPVAVTSTAEPGVTHTFHTWSAITAENVDGRVWEGIHYRFSDVTGVALGRRVAGYGLRRLAALGL